MHVVDPADKWTAFLEILARHAPEPAANANGGGGSGGSGPRRRVLVFANTKRRVAEIGAACAAAGHEVDTLSGALA